METVRKRRDGTLIHVSEIAVPVTIDGKQVSYYHMFRDITSQKAAAEALQRAHSELAHLSRVTTIGELVASIAHEVNQPITAVVTSSSAGSRWLAQNPPNLDEVRDALTNITRDATRAADVIARIRTLVQKGVPQMDPQDIHEIIRSVLVLLDAEVRRADVRVHTQLAGSPFVTGDRVQLQQVVMNLVMNAIDAMRESPKKVLTITSQATADSLLVQIQDTGCGIPSEKADKVFNAFFTTKPGGVGMGLAISRSIVEAHGGRLWASECETGAVLNLALPFGE
jgi:C4-dicarboxylate-specific signal transduction histidine kinase